MPKPYRIEYTQEFGCRTFEMLTDYAHAPQGTLDRIDGPAVLHKSGSTWCRYGKKHRLDGPAYVKEEGAILLSNKSGLAKNEYWIDGKQYTKTAFKKLIEEIKQMPLELRLIDPRWWVREFK